MPPALHGIGRHPRSSPLWGIGLAAHIPCRQPSATLAVTALRPRCAAHPLPCSYGFVDAAYLFMSFFSLLTGVVLTAAKHMTTGWENSGWWPWS